ncbi:MAG: hypothetical protein ACM3SW_00120 [Actinomycetota bacterium]
MPKPLWTLHITKNQLKGSETTYTVTRHAASQAAPDSAASPQTSPQSWGRLSSVLGQIARTDASKLAALKEELASKGSAELPDVPLDSFDLRLIGFTDG